MDKYCCGYSQKAVAPLKICCFLALRANELVKNSVKAIADLPLILRQEMCYYLSPYGLDLLEQCSCLNNFNTDHLWLTQWLPGPRKRLAWRMRLEDMESSGDDCIITNKAFFFNSLFHEVVEMMCQGHKIEYCYVEALQYLTQYPGNVPRHPGQITRFQTECSMEWLLDLLSRNCSNLSLPWHVFRKLTENVSIFSSILKKVTHLNVYWNGNSLQIPELISSVLTLRQLGLVSVRVSSLTAPILAASCCCLEKERHCSLISSCFMAAGKELSLDYAHCAGDCSSSLGNSVGVESSRYLKSNMLNCTQSPSTCLTSSDEKYVEFIDTTTVVCPSHTLSVDDASCNNCVDDSADESCSSETPSSDLYEIAFEPLSSQLKRSLVLVHTNIVEFDVCLSADDRQVYGMLCRCLPHWKNLRKLSIDSSDGRNCDTPDTLSCALSELRQSGGFLEALSLGGWFTQAIVDQHKHVKPIIGDAFCSTHEHPGQSICSLRHHSGMAVVNPLKSLKLLGSCMMEEDVLTELFAHALCLSDINPGPTVCAYNGLSSLFMDEFPLQSLPCFREALACNRTLQEVSLETFSFESPNSDLDGVFDAFSGLPSLRKFSLACKVKSYNSRLHADSKLLNLFAKCSLDFLRIHQCFQAGAFPECCVRALMSNRNIHTFIWTGNFLDSLGMRQISSVLADKSALPRLSNLNLSDNAFLRSDVVELLSALSAGDRFLNKLAFCGANLTYSMLVQDDVLDQLARLVRFMVGSAGVSDCSDYVSEM